MVATVCDSMNRSLYLFGGRRTPEGGMERTCIRYSATADRWHQCASMRFSRGIGQAVTCRNLVYVLGGCVRLGTGLTRVEYYDPAANTWRTLTDMPEPNHDFGAVCWRDSLIYLLGGGNWSPSSPPRDRVRVFDPATGIWDTATSLPVPLGAMAAGIIADTVLIADGWTADGPTNAVWQGVISNDDPSRIEWQQFDSMPAARRSRPIGASVGGLFYVVGGILEGGSVSSEAWAFDLRSRTWQALPDKPVAVSDFYGTPALGGRLYFPGGFSGIQPYSSRHDALDVGDYRRDAGASSVLSPSGRLELGGHYPVRVLVRNSGLVEDTVNASVRITDSLSQQLLFESETWFTMSPGRTDTTSFGDFVPSVATYFVVSASARSTGDENPDNDTTWQRCRTLPGSEPDGYGYVYQSTQEPDSIEFEWADPSGGVAITDWTPNPDDGVSRRDLPFSFPFYGDSIRRVYVSTDGFIETSSSTAPTNRRLPFFELTDVIAPFWDDLTLRERGQVIETRTADAVVYTWLGVPRYGEPGDSLTFQVVLHRSGQVRFNYLRMAGDRTSSTVGIQGENGTWNWCLEYVYDGEPPAHVPADSVSVLFSCMRAGITESPFPVPHSPSSFCLPTVCAGRALDLNLRWSTARPPAITVCDVTGRPVATLTVEGPGRAELRWNLADNHGHRLPAGAYFLLASIDGSSIVRKLVIVR